MAAGLPEAVGLGCGGSGALEGRARAGFVVDEEEQAGVLGDGDLGVVAGGFKLAVAVEKSRVQFVGAFDARAQHRGAQAMEVAAACVKNKQALGGEDAGVEIGEGLGEGAAGPVGGDQRIGCVGGAQQLKRAVDEGRDAFVDGDAADPARGCGLAGLRVFEFFQRLSRGKADVIDLGEVVVFSRQPKDGGVGMAGCRGLSGAGDCGGCLEGDEQRTAKEANLLAGDNGSCALGEGGEGACGWRGFARRADCTSSGQCGGSGGRCCQAFGGVFGA